MPFTKSLLKVSIALDSNPAVRCAGVDMRIVNVDRSLIQRVLFHKVFQLLPRGLPRKSSNNNVVKSRHVARRNKRHSLYVVMKTSRKKIAGKVFDKTQGQKLGIMLRFLEMSWVQYLTAEMLDI